MLFWMVCVGVCHFIFSVPLGFIFRILQAIKYAYKKLTNLSIFYLHASLLTYFISKLPFFFSPLFLIKILFFRLFIQSVGRMPGRR